MADSPKSSSDLVRDHLANERTFLAWVRTAIALLGFGMLLARFSVLLAGLGASDAARSGMSAPPTHTHSSLLGLIFAGASLVTLLFATMNYFRTRRMIGARDYQSLGWALAVFAAMIGLVGCASVVYLVLLTPR